MKQAYEKKAEMPLSEVIEKLKSNDPTFTELNLQEIKYNPTSVGIVRVSDFDDEALLELAAAIQENQTIKRFIFNLKRYFFMGQIYSSSRTWTHTGAIAIGNALKDHPALEEIHLPFDQTKWTPSHQTGMTSQEMSGILLALSGKAKIKTLYVATDLSDDVLDSLGRSLADNTTLESVAILSSDVNNQYYKFKNNVLKTFVAGFAGKSLQHLNLKLRLNDASIEILSQHLSKTNTLKTIILNECNLTHTGMIFVTNILKNNPYVTYLDLSDNPLGLNESKILAGALPNLLQLRTLLLSDTNFDGEALGVLAEAWRKSNLKIVTFEINMSNANYNDSYIAAVKKIIRNNKYLKKLSMIGDRFEKGHFYLLQDLLQDPKECRLQEFIFGGDIVECDEDFNNDLINTSEKNPNLTKLDPLYSTSLLPKHEEDELTKRSTLLSTAWRRNVAIQKTSQQLFIEKAIFFSNMYFSSSEDTKKPHYLSWLPVDVFLLVLYQLGQESVGRNDEDIIQCARLIFENFSARRELIKSNKYDPLKINSNSKAQVSKWWSLSSRGDNPKRIFQQSTVEDNEIEADQVNSGSPALQG